MNPFGGELFEITEEKFLSQDENIIFDGFYDLKENIVEFEANLGEISDILTRTIKVPKLRKESIRILKIYIEKYGSNQFINPMTELIFVKTTSQDIKTNYNHKMIPHLINRMNFMTDCISSSTILLSIISNHDLPLDLLNLINSKLLHFNLENDSLDLFSNLAENYKTKFDFKKILIPTFKNLSNIHLKWELAIKLSYFSEIDVIYDLDMIQVELLEEISKNVFIDFEIEVLEKSFLLEISDFNLKMRLIELLKGVNNKERALESFLKYGDIKKCSIEINDTSRKGDIYISAAVIKNLDRSIKNDLILKDQKLEHLISINDSISSWTTAVDFIIRASFLKAILNQNKFKKEQILLGLPLSTSVFNDEVLKEALKHIFTLNFYIYFYNCQRILKKEISSYCEESSPIVFCKPEKIAKVITKDYLAAILVSLTKKPNLINDDLLYLFICKNDFRVFRYLQSNYCLKKILKALDYKQLLLIYNEVIDDLKIDVYFWIFNSKEVELPYINYSRLLEYLDFKFYNNLFNLDLFEPKKFYNVVFSFIGSLKISTINCNEDYFYNHEIFYSNMFIGEEIVAKKYIKDDDVLLLPSYDVKVLEALDLDISYLHIQNSLGGVVNDTKDSHEEINSLKNEIIISKKNYQLLENLLVACSGLKDVCGKFLIFTLKCILRKDRITVDFVLTPPIIELCSLMGLYRYFLEANDVLSSSVDNDKELEKYKFRLKGIKLLKIQLKHEEFKIATSEDWKNEIYKSLVIIDTVVNFRLNNYFISNCFLTREIILNSNPHSLSDSAYQLVLQWISENDLDILYLEWDELTEDLRILMYKKNAANCLNIFSLCCYNETAEVFEMITENIKSKKFTTKWWRIVLNTFLYVRNIPFLNFIQKHLEENSSESIFKYLDIPLLELLYFNFPEIYEKIFKEDLEIKNFLMKESQINLNSVITTFSVLKTGFRLNFTYDSFYGSIVFSNKRWKFDCSFQRKNILNLKILKLLKSSFKFITILGVWKVEVDNMLLDKDECPICYFIADNGCNLPEVKCKRCKNEYHKTCFFDWVRKGKKSECPMCRFEIKI